MCRLFGMLSVISSTPEKYLLKDPCSLYVQSRADEKRLQSDGWGIGYYMNGKVCLFKSEKPVYEESEKFSSIVAEANSNIIIAHIRRASNPRGLPRGKIISIENSQPFAFRNYLFAHNGVINIPDETAESLGEWKQRIRGLNDSEIYFWHVIKEVENGASFQRAVKDFERKLSEIWKRVRDKYPDKDRPYIGLNALFSDGKRLYAYCKYHEIDNEVMSLCFRDQPSFQMSYLLTPECLVVASERTNREEEWKPIGNGYILIGQVEEEKINVGIQRVA